jgi:uncharacterized protein
MSLIERLKVNLHPHQQRLPQVQHTVQMLLLEQQSKSVERDRDLEWEYEHIEQAIHYAKTLALRRKIDPDLAGCALALQNVGRIVSGKSEGHAEAGYHLAKRLFTAMGCFTPTEIEQLSTAVRNHSRKDKVDNPLDELAKDVDVYVRYVQGHEIKTEPEQRRLSTVRLEMQRKT